MASALIHDEYKTNILNPKNNQEAKEVFSESQNQEHVERFISEQFHLQAHATSLYPFVCLHITLKLKQTKTNFKLTKKKIISECRKKNIALKKHGGNSSIQAFCDSDF